MSEHTPTPWRYRPNRHDDWGWIRGPETNDKEIAPLVAMARSGSRESAAFFDEHRANKTDPYEANAAFIVKAVNNHAKLVEALNICRKMISGEIIEAAVIDTQTMEGLGAMIDRVLAPLIEPGH